ncbi:MAG TPA: FAD-dependent monooxygenase [Burkholderiales bacterium]|nr:FAD-dependent monooxygenase [Burkholderiales bacterium]
MKRYDAIVIGGGPAGSMSACLLARAGWSVILVEKTAFPRRKVCGEFISAPALALLARAGFADDVLDVAGPEIRELAVYAGERIITGPMPRGETPIEYGRALGREHLDTLLLDRARAGGVEILQPWRVTACRPIADAYAVEAKSSSDAAELVAPVVIDAHGSWEAGVYPGSTIRERQAGSDLFAFKAHFSAGALPTRRMPLLAFPGGYGGLVTSDGGRMSFSCCVRRDALKAFRTAAPGSSAGNAVFAHVSRTCRGFREAAEAAVREGPWLAAGPLQPGIRFTSHDGCFAVGNALGEAHPIVAEGISMALQSAWLLCERLVAAPRSLRGSAWNAVARDYEAAYRANFAQRIAASRAFAAAAMRPSAAGAVAHVLQGAPGLLAFGARWAGKVAPLAFGSGCHSAALRPVNVSEENQGFPPKPPFLAP